MKTSQTIHYIFTFIAAVLLIGTFATFIFTGKDALLPLDSWAGSILIGLVFIGYALWLAYDSAVTENKEFMTVLKTQLTSSATMYCIYAFWFVFILVPGFIRLAR